MRFPETVFELFEIYVIFSVLSFNSTLGELGMGEND